MVGRWDEYVSFFLTFQHSVPVHPSTSHYLQKYSVRDRKNQESSVQIVAVLIQDEVDKVALPR